MFKIRTIRNGKVKINNKFYAPDEEHGEHAIPYIGQLDGMRYAFGLYTYPGRDGKDFVSLWGTEEMYRADDERHSKLHGHTPDCIDGIFHWIWWMEMG
jgi:hypothetical protein